MNKLEEIIYFLKKIKMGKNKQIEAIVETKKELDYIIRLYTIQASAVAGNNYTFKVLTLTLTTADTGIIN